MSELGEQLQKKLVTIIDTMEDEEIYSLLNMLSDDEEEREISELIAIKGEMKKLTKMVYKSIEQNAVEVEEDDEKRELKPLIDFHQFLLNSKESLNHLPKISHFGLNNFKKAFYAFEKGFNDIELLYSQLMEHFNLIETAQVGAKFDPTMHEAMEIEKENLENMNIITEVFHQGYRVDNEIIKYAQVKVGSVGI